MRKSKDRRHAEKKAWKNFSAMIRLEASDSKGFCHCYTCRSIKFWKEMDVGHYKPQGCNKGLKFDERNCHVQDTSCNRFKHGNLSVYAERLVAEYGPTILQLLSAKQAMHIKYSQSAFEVMAEEYKKRAIAAAEKRGLEYEPKRLAKVSPRGDE